MISSSALAAIVVMGGRSSRMGRSKAWLDLGGAPLVARVVERVRPWVGELVVVAAPAQPVPPLEAAMVVRDALPGEGPLPALLLGLETIGAPWALALGCDAPFVRGEVMRMLAARAGDDVAAVVPRWAGRPQPLVALYRKALAPSLAGLVERGERRLHAVLALPGVHVLEEPEIRAVDPEGESFRALNTPEDYEAARAAWLRRPA